jgi:hypothetical protein
MKLFVSMFSGHCTWWPDIYFGVDLSLACYDHDAAYLTRNIKLKIKSDFKFAKDWWKAPKSYHRWWQKLGVKTTTPFAFIAVATLGWGVWIYGRFND